jgi:hypothetical protein
MNVKQLIEKLQTFDPELIVVINGYEGGVEEINHAEKTRINLNANTEWYYGDHAIVPIHAMPCDCEAILID